MCFVFGEKKDPDEDVVRFIEDTVRLQLIEMVRRRRRPAPRRALTRLPAR